MFNILPPPPPPPPPRPRGGGGGGGNQSTFFVLDLPHGKNGQREFESPAGLCASSSAKRGGRCRHAAWRRASFLCSRRSSMLM